MKRSVLLLFIYLLFFSITQSQSLENINEVHGDVQVDGRFFTKFSPQKWYLNEFVKVAVNYEYSIFRNISGLKPLEDERLILTRFQIAF